MRECPICHEAELQYKQRTQYVYDCPVCKYRVIVEQPLPDVPLAEHGSS